MLFPLSNAFLAVIPVDDGGRPFQDLPPAVVSAVTMLTCIFLTFATFGRRDRFADPRSRGRYARSARICFAAALAALAGYVLAPSGLYRALITDSPDSAIGLALYDGLFAALYVVTFALLTRAFLLLAMLEYFAEESTAPGAVATASGVPGPKADGGQRQDAT
ncbi:hypothetical protein [Micromonospora sp. NPDC049891]|uniref:hypothetical protein n=1 Tax=Micromonospora sp. NPDC049891 TaxID=3155655 RepID=UPI003409FF63